MIFSDNINLSTNMHSSPLPMRRRVSIWIFTYLMLMLEPSQGTACRQSTDNLDLSSAGLGRRSSHRAPEYIHYV